MSKAAKKSFLPTSDPPQQARPIRSETRATLVASIARGRRWLNELVENANVNVESIAKREKCSVRQVNMTRSRSSHRAPPSKAVCHAALESSDFVMPQQNGASSSKPSD